MLQWLEQEISSSKYFKDTIGFSALIIIRTTLIGRLLVSRNMCVGLTNLPTV